MLEELSLFLMTSGDKTMAVAISECNGKSQRKDQEQEKTAIWAQCFLFF